MSKKLQPEIGELPSKEIDRLIDDYLLAKVAAGRINIGDSRYNFVRNERRRIEERLAEALARHIQTYQTCYRYRNRDGYTVDRFGDIRIMPEMFVRHHRSRKKEGTRK